jgi:hypothetical protein
MASPLFTSANFLLEVIQEVKDYTKEKRNTDPDE